MARSDGPEVAVVERGDFRDVEAFGDGDDGRVGRTEREVGLGLHELGHPLAVVLGEVNDAERVLDDRAQERGHDRCWDEDLPSCEVQTGEPRRRPDGRWLLLVLTAGLGEDGRDALIGKILDDTPQFVALGAIRSRVAREAPVFIAARWLADHEMVHELL